MNFVKTHLISLICGVLALAFIVVAVLGMSSGDAVEKEMQKRLSVAREIDSLKNNPKNEKSIEVEKRRSERFQQEYEEVLNKAKEINKREPLTEGIFPKPQTEALPYKFREDYETALYRLPGQMKADGLPTQADVADEEQNIADLLAHEAEIAESAEAAKPINPEDFTARNPRSGRNVRSAGPPDVIDPGGGRMVTPIPMGGRTAFPQMGAAQTFRPTTDEPKYNAVLRAQVTRAKNIRCYADIRSFHQSPIVTMDSAPPPVAMWQAQVGLWIQRDVVDAIAALNDAVAQSLPADQAYIENMPVKRLKSIRVWGYKAPQGLWTFPAAEQVGTAANVTPAPSFTGRTSDDQFDVVRFTVIVIVDQRRLNEFVDAVYKQNFYQLVGLNFNSVESVTSDGYMYGTAPVIEATLDFEGYLARDVFVPLMPAEVKTALGIQTDENN